MSTNKTRADFQDICLSVRLSHVFYVLLVVVK